LSKIVVMVISVLMRYRITQQCLQLRQQSWLTRWGTTLGFCTTMKLVLVIVTMHDVSCGQVRG